LIVTKNMTGSPEPGFCRYLRNSQQICRGRRTPEEKVKLRLIPWNCPGARAIGYRKTVKGAILMY
jgi:hypothetical protein